MKNIIAVLLVFSFAYVHAQVKLDNSANKHLSLQNIMKIEPLFSSKNYSECMGIILDKKKGNIFFATNGKYIHKYNLLNSSEPVLLATIIEVKNAWNDDYGDTFVHEMKLGNDGFIYAVAENCVIKINPENGLYTTIIKDGFSGPWGAYGLDLDSVGNIYVGDHHGGIHVYLKNKNWSRKTIISSTDSSTKKSFGSVLLKKDMLYYLDFENSLLISASLMWKNDSPEIINAKTLDLHVPYPEFMQIWNGDIFVKAARENTMLRIRNNEIIQKFNFTSDQEVSPIVTFSLDVVNDNNKCIFYGMSWGPNGTLYSGELTW
jgi:hypothetical protein